MNSQTESVFAELDAWYARDNGQYLLRQLQTYLDDILDTAFGYHLLQTGLTAQHPLFTNSPVNHRVYVSPLAGPGVGLVSNSDELPLESDSIDILIAHHGLEFEDNPHQALREMQRVLAPQGHLVLIGFNPYSLQGSYTGLRGLVRRPLWRYHHPLGSGRLTDWLHLLGCEVQATNYLYTLPPVGSGRLRRATTVVDQWLCRHNAPLGGLYVLHSIKQVSGLNRPRRRLLPASERLIGLAVPKPASVPSPTPAIHTPRTGDVAA